MEAWLFLDWRELCVKLDHISGRLLWSLIEVLCTLDLSVFAKPLQGGRTQTVGSATLRMADVSEVVRLLSERLRFEDLLLAGESAARKSKRLKARKPWVHCL